MEINAVGLREAKRLCGKNQKKKSTKLLFECHCKSIINSLKLKDSSVLVPPAVPCSYHFEIQDTATALLGAVSL